ncbi:MAG: hypothetical protein JW795_13370 [Chitinivibrionales bacterium]|nr:hypothetical protein [Chitinivibrionales bacterium]
MKKYLYLTCILLICGTPLYAAITVDLPLQDLSVQNVRGVAQFAPVELAGEPGQPNLPVYNCSVLLPPDADLKNVTYSFEGLIEEVVEGTYEVEPAFPIATHTGLCWPANRTIVDNKDVSVYSTDALIPSQHIESRGVGLLWSYKIADVKVNLFRYNPATKKLYQVKAGKLVVSVAKEAGYHSLKHTNILIPEHIAQRVKGLVVNFDEFATQYSNDYNFTSSNKVVILTTAAIKSGAKNFDAFLESKKKRGLDVQVVTDWGTGGAAARKWLQDNYQKIGIHHVLIIGNYSSDVPMLTLTYTGGAAGANTPIPSEWPFAQMSGEPKSDSKAELSVGRFPVYNNDLTALDVIMKRVIDFEQADKSSIAWRRNALMGAGGYAASSKGDLVYEATHNEIITKATGWKDYRIYGTNYGQPTGTPDKTGISESIFTAQWKSGSYGIIDWCTHGSPTLAQYVFKSSGATEVGDKYPAFCLNGSCSNSEPKTANNLTYSILKSCGMGSIGGNDYTYWTGGLSASAAKQLATNGLDEGWAYNFARFMITNSMSMGDCLTALRDISVSDTWCNRVPYVLYGDPTIGIETCKDGNTNVTTPLNTNLSLKKLTTIVNQSSVIFNFAPVANSATVKIYTLAGSEITELSVTNTEKTATWNLTNKFGSKASAGIYLAKLCRTTDNGSPIVATTKFMVK